MTESKAVDPGKNEAATAGRPPGRAPETAPAPSLAVAPPAVPKSAPAGRAASAAGTPSVAASAGAGAPNPGADDRAASALAPVLPDAVRPPPVPPASAPAEAARRFAEAGPAPSAGAADRPGAVFVPEVGTARITRGDSLWQISRRTYGKGNRYTVIYDANQDQIRNPDRIYPGQIFVLPKDMPASGTPAPKRT